MSSVRKVGEGRAARFEARWRTPDGGDRRQRFLKERDAKAHLATVDGAMVRGAYVDAAAGRVTFREVAERWRVDQNHRPTTRAHVETMLRRHAYPTLGDRPIGAIRKSEVKAWVRGLSDVLAPSTVGVVHGFVSSVMKGAVEDGLIAGNPCAGVSLPKPQPAPVVPLTVEQVDTIAGAVPDRMRAAVILAAGTGMRQGEVYGLTLDRVDFLRRSLRVDRQLVTVPGRAPFLGPPKTTASHRTIPLPQVVLDALAAHVAAYAPTAQTVPVMLTGGRELSESVALMFTTAAGKPIRRTSYAERWREAVAVGGAPAGTGMHALRHFYASLLIRHSESVKTVQARLGHATAAETLDTYAHLWPDSDDRTREAVDGVLGGSGGVRGSFVASEGAAGRP